MDKSEKTARAEERRLKIRRKYAGWSIKAVALIISASLLGFLFSVFPPTRTLGDLLIGGFRSGVLGSGLKQQALTTEQVSEKVRPSVVGIIQYRDGIARETGEGSGIVLTGSGLIVTNNHVVEGSSRLTVVTYDGKKHPARIVGTDVRMDVAVIKINSDSLKPAEFGDSRTLKVGQQVVAVGNPSGVRLAGTVTQGIVSALNRRIDVGNGPVELIQTDAAINPGNSGGALANMYGQIIGINSAKIAQTGFEGIGFSIPITDVKAIIASLIKYGYVQNRVKFGFECSEVDAAVSQATGLPRGIYVCRVEPGGPAALSGIHSDDVITAIDGVKCETLDIFITERDRHKPGDRVTLTIARRDVQKPINIQIELKQDGGKGSENG